jgi:Plasmid pRiA4b ORF-3-like protein
VVVQGISPLIWRRRLIRHDVSLATFHAPLQIVFAWSDTHLHCFCSPGKEYGSTHLGGPSFAGDPRQVPLSTRRLPRGERFTYVYNFIDRGECALRLEAILPLAPRRIYPVCLGGKRAAPPEDGGGAWAYMQLGERHHVPREAMTVVARALDRLLAADDQTTMRQVIGDTETFREAVDQLDAYRQFQPEHCERRDVKAQRCALVQQAGT